jgi:hypothetical protein
MLFFPNQYIDGMFIIYAIRPIHNKFRFLQSSSVILLWRYGGSDTSTHTINEAFAPPLLGPGHLIDLLHLDQKATLKIQ